MPVTRPTLRLTAALLALLLAAAVAAAENAPPKRTLYFIVNSGACPCQQDMCNRAKPIAAQAQSRLAAGVEYVSLDQGVQPEKVEPLIQKHKLFAFPVFLVVDADGKELFKTVGKVTKDEIMAKLLALGVITGP